MMLKLFLLWQKNVRRWHYYLGGMWLIMTISFVYAIDLLRQYGVITGKLLFSKHALLALIFSILSLLLFARRKMTGLYFGLLILPIAIISMIKDMLRYQSMVLMLILNLYLEFSMLGLHIAIILIIHFNRITLKTDKVIKEAKKQNTLSKRYPFSVKSTLN